MGHQHQNVKHTNPGTFQTIIFPPPSFLITSFRHSYIDTRRSSHQRLILSLLRTHTLGPCVQLAREWRRLRRLRLRISHAARCIRTRRGSHAWTWSVVRLLPWAGMASLLRILSTIHGQRVGTRCLASGGCVFAICYAEGGHTRALLLHGWGIVLRWGGRSCRRVGGGWCVGYVVLLPAAQKEPN